jgi:hypothetical protein
MNKRSSRSSKQQCATTPQPVNHACRDVGHDWQLTTNDTFRQCSRHDCRAVERFVYGSWVPVSSDPAHLERQQPGPASSTFYQLQLADTCQQLSFWSSHQHTQRPLDLESMTILTREQRAHFARVEREYYNLSSGRQRNRKAW